MALQATEEKEGPGDIEEEEEEEEADLRDTEDSLEDCYQNEEGADYHEPRGSRKRLRIGDVDKAPRIYTDNINQMCLVRCKLCTRTLSHGSLRDHLNRSHKSKRQEFVTYEYVRLTYYRCKICSAGTLFTHAAVSQHVRVFHNLTFSEYRAKFNGFSGLLPQMRRRRSQKSRVQDNNQTNPTEAGCNLASTLKESDNRHAEDNSSRGCPSSLESTPAGNGSQKLSGSSKMESPLNSSRHSEDYSIQPQKKSSKSPQAPGPLRKRATRAHNSSINLENSRLEETSHCQTESSPNASSGQLKNLCSVPRSSTSGHTISIDITSCNQTSTGSVGNLGTVEHFSPIMNSGITNGDETKKQSLPKSVYETRSRIKQCSVEIILQPKKSDKSPLQQNGRRPIQGQSSGGPQKIGSPLSCSSPKLKGEAARSPEESGTSSSVKEITFEHSLLDEYHSLGALRQKQQGRPSGGSRLGPPLPACRSSSPRPAVDFAPTLQEALRRLAGGCVEVSEVPLKSDPTISKEESLDSGENQHTTKQDKEEEESVVERREEGRGEQVSALDLCLISMSEEKESDSEDDGEEKEKEEREEEEYSDCDPNQFCEISMDSKLEDEDSDCEEGVLSGEVSTPSPTKQSEPGIPANNNRIVTDNLNLMCEYECLLCGASLKESTLSSHLKENHNEKRREGETHKYRRLTYYKCKICSKDITFYFAAVRDHIVKKHKMKMSDYKTRYQAFSQEQVCIADLSELAQVRCRVCGLVMLHHRVRSHLLLVHGTGRKGGYEFVKQTFHSCKLCGVQFLFSMEKIRYHVLSVHKMTLQQYATEHEPFTGEAECTIEDFEAELAVAFSESTSAARQNGRPQVRPLRRRRVKTKECEEEGVRQEEGEPGGAPLVFTDDLSSRCESKCGLCGKQMFQDRLGKHFETHHKNKKLGANGRNELVKKTYHRCKVCHSELVFNLQGIRKHVKRAHDLTLDGYREAYNAFTGGAKVKKGRPTSKPPREEEEKEVSLENCLFHQMEDNGLEGAGEDEGENEHDDL